MSIRPSLATVSVPAGVRRAALRGIILTTSVSIAVGLSGCTFTADEFEPLLVSRSDAGLPALAVDAGLPPLAEPQTSSTGCERESAASCSAAIGLIEPSVIDAGVAPPAPSLALPPCQDGFAELGAPEPLSGIEFDQDVYGPALSSDGRTLYFSAYIGGEQQIYSATRAARGAVFSNVVELPVVNSPAMDGSPFITADGQRLYFFSERQQQGTVGRRDIWVSELAGSDFGVPALVLGINSPSSDLLPWLTPDELTVLFISGRPGGRGGADVWRATRSERSAPFGEPSAFSELSSDANEGRAVLSSDGGSAFFTSDRGGSPDIWTATRSSPGAPFSNLRRVDALNSGAIELDVMLSSDDSELFFASTRSGRSLLYRAERSCR